MKVKLSPYLFSPLSLFFLLLIACQPNTKNSASAVADLEVQAGSSEQEQPITTFQQWLADPQPLVSAHRGGAYPGYPENAIATFQHIIDHTSAVIECDVSITKDGELILMHDKTLDRTTTGSGKVTEMTFAEIKDLYLTDDDGKTTSYRIPTLDEALAWGKEKALFTLDVKQGVPFEKVIATIEEFDAEAYAAVITYRIQDAKKVHTLNKNLMISVSAMDKDAIEQLAKSGIPLEKVLGFVGTKIPSKSHYEKLHNLGIKTILGTLGNLDNKAVAKGNDLVYRQYLADGADIIATDRPLEVAKVIRE